MHLLLSCLYENPFEYLHTSYSCSHSLWSAWLEAYISICVVYIVYLYRVFVYTMCPYVCERVNCGWKRIFVLFEKWNESLLLPCHVRGLKWWACGAFVVEHFHNENRWKNSAAMVEQMPVECVLYLCLRLYPGMRTWTNHAAVQAKHGQALFSCWLPLDHTNG